LPQTSECLLRFVHSAYREQSTPRELAERFPAAHDIAFDPMPLRSIFLAIAKAKRGSDGLIPAQEKIA
jgi:hypothetical protein